MVYVTVGDVFMQICKVLLNVTIIDMGLNPRIILIVIAYQQSIDKGIHLQAFGFGIASPYLHQYSIVPYAYKSKQFGDFRTSKLSKLNILIQFKKKSLNNKNIQVFLSMFHLLINSVYNIFINLTIIQMNPIQKSQQITVKNKHQYSCVQKVLCCKCFSCFQQQKILTSHIRKEAILRMMQDQLIQKDERILYDPVKIMILIYICNDDSIPARYIAKCKINPSTGVMNYRTDLEFYIPQICNFIAFHRNLENNYLRQAMEQICKLNFYFAHLYYFYMKSIERNVTKTQSQILKPVVLYNEGLLQGLKQHYQNVKCSALDQYLEYYEDSYKNEDQFIIGVIKDYETTKMEYGRYAKVKPQDIKIKKYDSIFQGNKGNSQSFQSTIDFFQDLFYLCDDLKNHARKKQKTIEYVKMMNENLPATAYIPFSKNCYRLCNILKIVTSQVRIFATKQRSPICLCFQIYCPSEHLTQNQQTNFWNNVEAPTALKLITTTNKRHHSNRQLENTAEFKGDLNISRKRSFNNIMFEQKLLSSHRDTNLIRQQLLQRNVFNESGQTELVQYNLNATKSRSIIEGQGQIYQDKQVKNAEEATNAQSRNVSNGQSLVQHNKAKSYRYIKGFNTNTKKYYINGLNKMFGQTLAETKKRISKNSIFGHFTSWDILYVIIKTNDDLKQEQFAMQLLHQFDYIFKLCRLPLILTTYQVLSMGPNKGIIQMVKDSVTFDQLKKTLKTEFPSALTLKDFFQIFYENSLVEAKQNFVKSLAAYCLVMYIIQAKDRHNGNILLHRSGKIFHIDFGFFLSNLPGKGIELQKSCPFKLLSEYIDVMDGTQSHYFKKFREYFFLGYKAIRKHQNKIIMLVKMMYSTGGMSMPCFQKGFITVNALEHRINPPGITNDSLLNEHCQMLINKSLDNWAAKWYDRFQYWAQGIFY